MTISVLEISQLSTEYIGIPVQATTAGTTHDPTGDVVNFAFVTGYGAAPTSGQWVAGSWAYTNNPLYPYVARCLIGPSGTTALTNGNYVVWLKVTDSPEIPVRIAGELSIF
jgi:hypothetical protein